MAKIDVSEVKKKILEIIQHEGPSLPVPIAKKIQMQPMFASAILSELLNEKRIKTSSMKIGSSPLYMIPGQEERLEPFTENLTGAEKEAYLKLKDNKFLEDSTQEPRTRVALRSIKDFAIPIQLNGKLYWKYMTISIEKLKAAIADEGDVAIGERVVGQQIWEDIQKEVKPENAQLIKNESRQTNSEVVNILTKEIETTKIQNKFNEILQEEKEKPTPKNIELVAHDEIKKVEENLNILEEKQAPRKIKKITEKDIFLGQVKEILTSKNIELLEVIQYDKKQLIAKARVKVDKTCILFFLDKKRPDEKDLQKAYKKSLEYKLPYFIVANSLPQKKLLETAEIYKSLLGFSSVEN
jgi:hypothetical protein